MADGLRGLGRVAGGRGVARFGWPLKLEKEVGFWSGGPAADLL